MLNPHFKIDGEFCGHSEDVRSICSQSGSSSLFATASRDKTIRIWKLPELSFYDNNADNTKQSGICLRILTGKISHSQRIHHFL